MGERATDQSSGAWIVAEERARGKGRPLPKRGATAAPSVQASFGLPNRIERLKRIEQELERQHRRLRAAWTELAEDCANDAAAFRERWSQRLRGWSFLEHDELVDEHNEWFPIEARLVWNRELDDYRAPFGLPWRKAHVDREAIAATYPPDLHAALRAASG